AGGGPGRPRVLVPGGAFRRRGRLPRGRRRAVARAVRLDARPGRGSGAARGPTTARRRPQPERRAAHALGRPAARVVNRTLVARRVLPQTPAVVRLEVAAAGAGPRP